MNYTGGEHGVMAAIVAMTAPPTYANQDSSGKPKQDKNTQKRNRTHPKDAYCEGCGDPSEILLCCTSCSICYHPVCDEPPLEEEAVKDMEWKCRSCRNKEVLAQGEKVETEGMGNNQPHELGRHVKIEPLDVDDVEMDEGDVLPEDNQAAGESGEMSKKIANVFNKVLATAKTLNPTPFEIPPSFHLNPHAFPGTSRSQIKKPGGRLKPTIVDLDNFKVPVPILVCFNCTKSCRLAPLLQCDYCPKLFHFDCLNPPLTTPPVGLWMCPLHVEPFLESKHLKSWKLSERVKLWDLTHEQINRSTVCVNFLKKCSRRHPPFSSKIPVTVPVPYNVPEGSGNHVIKRSYITELDSEHSDEEETKAKSLRKEDLFKCYEKTECSKESADFIGFDLPLTSKYQSKDLLKNTEEAQADIDEIKNKTETLNIQATESETLCDGDSTTDNPETEPCDTEMDSQKESASSVMSGIDLLLNAATVLSQKDERRVTFLKSLPMDQVYDLAAQRLEDIDTLFKSASQGTQNSNEARSASSAKKPATVSQPIAKNIIQFYCMNVAKLMKFSTSSIVIGTDHTAEPGSTSFNPELFVKCKRLSGFHAVIFYDRSRMQWEILNYSPYGLIIDSVMYCLKPVMDKVQEPRSDIETVKLLINKRRGILLEKAGNPRISPAEPEHDCPCLDAATSAIVKVKHEGSATICVGSEIQIGCLKLVVKSMETEEIVSNSGSGMRK